MLESYDGLPPAFGHPEDTSAMRDALPPSRDVACHGAREYDLAALAENAAGPTLRVR